MRVKHRGKGCITPLHSPNQSFTGRQDGAAATASDGRPSPTSPGLVFSNPGLGKNTPGLVERGSLTFAGVWCSWSCFPCPPSPCTVIREPPVPDRQSVVQIGFTFGHLYNLNVPDGTAMSASVASSGASLWSQSGRNGSSASSRPELSWFY